MCGIAGYSVVTGANSVNLWLIEAKTILNHRGPDDSGIFTDPVKCIGIVHTRLSIIDLSPLGHQPMLSDDGRVALVFNGEIYNFRELRAELEEKGHCFRGHSDTEVLLRLYLEHRHTADGVKAMLLRLNGIFAFALWDADCEAMLLARDALGVKPLYYSATETGFYFASELKALQLKHNKLDAAAIDRYLSFLWCPGEGTPSRQVSKLVPGEALWIKQGAIVNRIRWYLLPAFRSNVATGAVQSQPTQSDAIRATEFHLRQAVHRQMISDVPVGAFLSGGLDSSSIVAFARERNPDIRCFTIELAGGAEAGMADDLPYARRVAKHLGVPLDVVQVDAMRMAEDLADMVTQLDEPLADPAPLNVLYISRLARNCGMKVLLSGAGGDDLFSGYRRHRAVLAERYWDWLPHSVRRGLAGLAGTLDQRWAWGRRLRKAFDGAALEGDERLVNYFAWNRRDDLLALYTPEFRAAVGQAEASAPMLDFLADLPAEMAPLERMLVLEQRFFLADHNLTYTDKMSMAAGVEVRVPFLDLELVDFAQRIPISLKQRGSVGKWVLKKAMEPYLPQDVIHRPKSGFGMPLRRWMRFDLRELLGDVLGDSSLLRRGLFDPLAVRKLIAANDSGRVDASYTLLSLVCIELWCRRFIDNCEHSPSIIGKKFLHDG